MYNITVINNSTLDNNPKNFQVKDWLIYVKNYLKNYAMRIMSHIRK